MPSRLRSIWSRGCPIPTHGKARGTDSPLSNVFWSRITSIHGQSPIGGCSTGRILGQSPIGTAGRCDVDRVPGPLSAWGKEPRRRGSPRILVLPEGFPRLRLRGSARPRMRSAREAPPEPRALAGSNPPGALSEGKSPVAGALRVFWCSLRDSNPRPSD